MNNEVLPCERQQKYDLEPTQQRHCPVWSKGHVPSPRSAYGAHVRRTRSCGLGGGGTCPPGPSLDPPIPWISESILSHAGLCVNDFNCLCVYPFNNIDTYIIMAV